MCAQSTLAGHEAGPKAAGREPYSSTCVQVASAAGQQIRLVQVGSARLRGQSSRRSGRKRSGLQAQGLDCACARIQDVQVLPAKLMSCHKADLH